VVSDERETLLETGGGVRKALSYLGADPFFVCNTDSIWEERGGSALKKMSDSFDADRMDALLLLADKEESMGFEGAGDFFRETDGRIQHRGAAEAAPFAYTGVQFVTPRIVAPEPIEPFSFMRIWRRVMAEGRMYGAPLDGFWMHVGDPVARDAAEARLETAFAS
jgi:MurNAc alpha-1-phosphate uridylyltransferase